MINFVQLITVLVVAVAKLDKAIILAAFHQWRHHLS